MPQSINEIKNKISSMQSMKKITRAMQMVSVSKRTKTDAKVKNYASFIQTFDEVMEHIFATPSVEEHVFFKPNRTNNSKRCTGFLTITSDRGLAAGYNNNLLRQLQLELNERPSDEYKLYIIGTKGFDFARRFKLPIENEYVFVPDDLVYMDVEPIVNQVLVDYVHGIIDEVVIVYNNYITQLIQEPTMKTILPLEKTKEHRQSKEVYVFDPAESEIIQGALVKYMNNKIYGIILTGKLSEHAARMNAMQNATDNATEIIKDTQLVYNRARQAAITQEINEIVGGAMAIQ
jgi:F-type H+-transporting ATPase subunit gamma